MLFLVALGALAVTAATSAAIFQVGLLSASSRAPLAFDPAFTTTTTYLLTVNKAGSGSGNVAAPPEIDCGAECGRATTMAVW